MNPFLDDALAEARADMEDLMLDRVRITKPGPGGDGNLNEATGKYDSPAEPVVVYEGKARFQIRADINSNVVEPVVAEREWAYQTSTLQIPVEADPDDETMIGNPAEVRAGMVVLCTHGEDDSTLEGRQYGIKAGHHKSQASCQRLPVKEVTG